MWNADTPAVVRGHINYCLCFEQVVERTECHFKSKMANAWGHRSQPNRSTGSLATPRGDAAPRLVNVAKLNRRTRLVGAGPSLGSRVLVSVNSLCVVPRAAEELGIPNSKLVVYFTTADIFNKIKPFTRFKIIFGLTGRFANWYWIYRLSLKLSAVNNSSQSRGFQRPTGRRYALRRGISGVFKGLSKRQRSVWEIDTAADIFHLYHPGVTVTSRGY